jgi:hypothetical protein
MKHNWVLYGTYTSLECPNWAWNLKQIHHLCRMATHGACRCPILDARWTATPLPNHIPSICRWHWCLQPCKLRSQMGPNHHRNSSNIPCV